ncbi:diguanylate cyclase domain-containing protein [Knoellia sp. CPCC 206435]|uniref:sensor domain-containing diguanylate cyclase n=1 Tax=Knoellia terrae TaxID=3404797 RepID=UPI003B431A97
MDDRRLEVFLRAAFESSPDGLAIVGIDPIGPGRLQRVNPALATLTGRPLDHLLGAPLLALADPDDLDRWSGFLEQSTTGRQVAREMRCRRADGTGLWVDVTCLPVAAGPEPATQALVRLVDVTERHTAVAALEEAAHRDPLTGLLNRAGLQRRLESSAADARRGTLLYCDLDGLKRVNDTVGHDVGDEVLRTTAHRLVACLRSGDVVARLGGDEFVVVAFGIDGAALGRLGERIRTAVAEAIPHGTELLHLGISIGVAEMDGGARGLDAALHQADAAMYAAKRHRGRPLGLPDEGQPPP